MNIEGVLIGAVIFATVLLIYGGYYLYFYPKLASSFEHAALTRFMKFLQNLQFPYDEYSYFTDSHLVWSETDIPRILQLIHKSCRKNAPEIGVAAGPSQFLLHADESKKHVYIVFTNAKSFDWGSIPHYDKYIRSHLDSESRRDASEAQ